MAKKFNLGINDFLASFNGGARANSYAVILNFPAILSTINDNDTRQLSYMCKATSIPASNMGKAEVSFMGRKIKAAGDKEYDDWDITVINDNDYRLRNIFEYWLDRINGNVTNRASSSAFTNPSNYYATADVYHLKKDGTVIASYKISGLFPTAVQAIELAYETVDTIEEFNVTFSVNEWSRTDSSITMDDNVTNTISSLLLNVLQ